jgi:hypothetical protein
MLGKITAAAIAVAFSAGLAFADDPAGRYRVSGTNPGNGSKYSGSVLVERTGDTYRVTWDIGNTTFVGTGIGNDKGFAVAYRAGNQTGIAIYGSDGPDWKGVWTYANGREVGSELWTRR